MDKFEAFLADRARNAYAAERAQADYYTDRVIPLPEAIVWFLSKTGETNPETARIYLPKVEVANCTYCVEYMAHTHQNRYMITQDELDRAVAECQQDQYAEAYDL